MLREKAFRLGIITKTHGVGGQLSLSSELKLSDPEEWPEWIFLDIDKGLVPFRTDSEYMVLRDDNHLIIALDGYDSQDKVQKLVGYEVWFPNEFKKSILGSPAENHPLIGFVLSDPNYGKLGVIEDYIDLPNNPLLKLTIEGREVLVPAREEWIISLDEQGKRMSCIRKSRTR